MTAILEDTDTPSAENAHDHDATTQPPGTPPGADASLSSILGALLQNGQTLFEAETGYLKAMLGFAFKRLPFIVALVILGLFFLFFLLMAIVVGLLLALAPMIGPWGALALVSVTLAILTGVSLFAAFKRARRMIGVLTGSKS